MQPFDFDAAITMHRAWKMKFHLAINNIRGSDFDSGPLANDQQCKLGQWLADNAGELAALPSARELATVHEQFHRQAAALADDIKNGKVLRPEDPAIAGFVVLSGDIESRLLKLKDEVQRAA